MIQVQRFNKALKLAVILGDLVILNVLFISFNSIWNEVVWGKGLQWHFTPNSNSIQRMLFLRALSQEVSYYIAGEPVPIKLYSGHSVTSFYFSLLSTSLIVLSELEIYSSRFFVYYFHSAFPLHHFLSSAFPLWHTAIQKPWR